MALINTAYNLWRVERPLEKRVQTEQTGQMNSAGQVTARLQSSVHKMMLGLRID